MPVDLFAQSGTQPDDNTPAPGGQDLLSGGPRDLFQDANLQPEADGPPAPAPKPEGFVDNVAEDMRQRGSRLADIQAATKSGQQGPLSGIWQGVTNEFGAANDVVGQGIKSLASTAFHALPDSTQQSAENALDSIAASPEGKTVKNMAQDYQNNLNTFNQQNPEMGRNLQGVREVGAFAMPGGTGDVLKGAYEAAPAVAQVGLGLTKAVPAVAGKAIQGAGEIARDALGMEPKEVVPTADEMRATSQQTYADAHAKGANFTPDFTNNIINTAKNVLPKSAFGKIANADSISSKFADELSQFKGQSMTLEDAEALDQNLSDHIESTYDPKRGGYTAEGRQLIKLQGSLRDMVENADPKHVGGGTDGLAAYRTAVKQWAASRRMSDVENIINQAQYADQPGKAIMSGFAKILKNPAKLKGYTDDEIALMQKAAKGGIGQDTLRILGSRLLPIAAIGSGGGLGADAVAQASSIAARGASQALQVKKANDVAREIAKRMKPIAPVQQAPVVPKPLALPAPYKAPPTYGSPSPSWYYKAPVPNAITPAPAQPGLLPSPGTQYMAPNIPVRSPTVYGQPNADWLNETQRPYSPAAPARTGLLSAPTPDTMVNPRGVARPMTDTERLASDAARERASNLGLTPDVRAAQKSSQVTNAYDALQKGRDAMKEQHYAYMLKQNQMSVKDMMKYSKERAQNVADILGNSPETSNLGKALEDAIKKKYKD